MELKQQTSLPPHLIINEAMMNGIKHSSCKSNYAFGMKLEWR